MNRIYRNIWSSRLGCFVAVSEVAGARGKSSGVSGALLASVLLSSGATAQATPAAPDVLPTGGTVVAGQASITTHGAAMTVDQGSSRAAINWQNFNIGSNATVQFRQPDASSVMLNRVVGNETSVIDGALRANGQVWLVNPNGVLFNAGARVDVGGLVASTRNIADADFLAGRAVFQGSGAGEIVNHGVLTAAQGGYVALIGKAVRNDGVVTATLGTVAAAAGNKVTLNFGGDAMVGVAIDEGALNALVDNGGALRADGGQIVLSAKTASSLLDAVVNNTGEIRAQTIANRNGRILLLGDMQHGAVDVAGTLDAGAPHGGSGGFIETSASRVSVRPGATVTTLAAGGANGQWLIDPTDFVVAATGGDMTGATLSSSLAGGSVQIQSSAGAGGNGGAVVVNDTVNWSANTTLTLDAQSNIYINAPIVASGAAGKVFLKYGQGASNSGNASKYAFGLGTAGGFAGHIDLQPGQNFSTQLGNDGPVQVWTVINALGTAASNSAADLQGMNGAPAGRYVLGADIDAGATATQGFTPIGNAQTPFTGQLDGLGHTISNLVVNAPATDEVGLFGRLSGTVANLTLSNAQITGRTNVGALAGFMNGANASQVAVTGTSVTGEGSLGLVTGHLANGAIANSYARNGSVTGTSAGGTEIGGLIGAWDNPPTALIPNSIYDMGSTVVTVNQVDKSAQVTLGGVGGAQFADWLGGQRALPAGRLSAYFTQNGDGSWRVSTTADLQNLLGFTQLGNTTFKLDNDIDTGAIAGWRLPTFSPGINFNNKTLNLAIDQPYNSIVGLFGYGSGASNLNLTGYVNGLNTVGAVAGFLGGSISNVTSSVVVNGQDNVGGLAGFAYGAGITDSSFSGTVSGRNTVGGLAGYLNGSIDHGTFSGTVNGSGAVGGLAGGTNTSSISAGVSTGTVNGGLNGGGGSIGGIAGGTYRTTVTGSSASGIVNGGANGDTVGGLVGFNQESLVTLSTSSGAAVSGRNNVGGAVGANSGAVTLTTSSRPVQGGSVVGGLVGGGAGSIDQSSASGTVTASGDDVGGLLGDSSAFGGSVSNSFATGAVNGRSNVGGLIGYNENSWTALGGRPVSNSWSSGAVTGTGTGIGGLIGLWFDPASVVNSHYNVDGVAVTVNGQDQSAQVTLGGLYGTQYAEWQGAGRTALDPAGYFGAADANGKYALSTAQNLKDLLAFAGDASLSFRLTNDIDVSNLAGWRLPFLAASLGGGSHLITGLNTRQSWNNFGGLIGYLSGTVDGVGVVGSAAGGTYVGGIAGLNRGAISNSYSVVDVTGSSNVGGLVGLNAATGSIADTYATGSVNGTDGAQLVGGLVGANAGAVASSYAAGAVHCLYCWSTGGLVGNGAGWDTNGAYLAGTVTAGFWNMDATGMTTDGAGAGVTGLGTAGMKAASNFTGAGWNASLSGGSNATWRLYDGAAAPLLRSFLGAYSVMANSGTRDYDGTTAGFGVTYSSLPDNHVFGTATANAGGKDAGTWNIAPVGLYSDQRGYDIAAIGGTAVIAPRTLTSTGAAAAGKVYDGTGAAAVTAGTLSGMVGNETLGIAGVTGSFDSANAGLRTATVGYTLADGANGGLAANYVVAPTLATATIAAKALTVTGTGVADKVYDGTGNAAASAGTISGMVGNETLGIAGVNGTFDNANAGHRTATVGYTLADGANGGLAANYVLAPTLVSATITPKALTVLGTAVANKAYDGTTGAAAAAGTLSGLVGNETLAIAGVGASFDSANAGLRTATVNYGLADGANGGLAANYVVAPILVTATIARRALTVTGTGVADKVYDGTASAAAAAGTLGGMVGNETIGIAGVTGSFDSANAGRRTATVGYTLADGANGGLAANYVLAPVAVSATIAPKALTVTGTGVADKVYDGTGNAIASAGTLTGMVGNETIGIAGVNGNFDSANAGRRTATVGYTLADGANGGLAANYAVAPTLVSATITPKALTVLGTGVAGKAYDGTTGAAAVAGTLSGLVGNETLAIAGVGASFDSANAGRRTATVGYTLGDGANGGLAANYALAPVAVSATIAPRALTAPGTAIADKVYDGTAGASAAAGTLNGLVGNETLGIAGVDASFDSANAGRRTAIVGYRLVDGADGGLAANYVLAPVAVSATIAPKTLTVTGTSAADKNYDGNASASITPGTLGGLVGDQTLGVSATGRFDGANPGPHTATVSYTLTDGANGGLAANYAVAAASTPGAQIRPMSTVDNARTAAQQALALAQLSTVATQQATTLATATAAPNVVTAPNGIATSFGPGSALTLLSAPRVGERSEAVPLGAARDMLGGNGGGGTLGSGQDVRVPVGRNTLADIVNGGVRLPSGVDQLLFVVADGKSGNETGRRETGKQPMESNPAGVGNGAGRATRHD